MVKQELVDRSPVRFFKNATNGGLKAGEIGALTSKKGLGKTSVLVQIGLDKLFQDKHVVHISFNQNADFSMTWYEDILMK
jgi:KaiC/GvpD/RAD55 family RecA-like ATPase